MSAAFSADSHIYHCLSFVYYNFAQLSFDTHGMTFEADKKTSKISSICFSTVIVYAATFFVIVLPEISQPPFSSGRSIAPETSRLLAWGNKWNTSLMALAET